MSIRIYDWILQKFTSLLKRDLIKNQCRIDDVRDERLSVFLDNKASKKTNHNEIIVVERKRIHFVQVNLCTSEIIRLDINLIPLLKIKAILNWLLK